MDDDFDILASKVLSGDATEAESKRLREMLAKDARLKAEFEDLRLTWSAIKEFGPLAASSEAGPSTERKEEWKAAVERKFQTVPMPPPEEQDQEKGFARGLAESRNVIPMWTLALAAACVAAAVIAFLLLPRRPITPVAYLVPTEGDIEIRRNGKTLAIDSPTSLAEADEIHLPAKATATMITPHGSVALRGPQEIMTEALLDAGAVGETNGGAGSLRRALFDPSSGLLGLLATRRSSQSIPVYSPAGFTANLSPPILWKAAPDKSYDVSITDELAPAAEALRASGVIPPLDFNKAWPNRRLVGDGLYRLRITETGKPLSASELVFRTLPDSDETVVRDGAAPLLTAYNTLTARPPRLGDALAVLQDLPPELGGSELALRLKAFAFGQLGYAEDFEAALLQIKGKNAE